ncbi:sialate O-acetylesterase [Cerasicoccus frondis]|uniref:sialate O-acetylesterase n=1 Tax=Cerasicoccus frondis TaxID=490090 RepID=UPI002852D092|nr:sialate O-acetylesterase [Cerasicoccus frondis]
MSTPAIRPPFVAIFLACAYAATTQLWAGELIWEAGLESEIPGQPPTAIAYRPLTSQGELDALPITDSNSIGSIVFPMDGAPTLPAPVNGEPYLRIFDYHETQAAGVEWNFAEVDEGYDAIKLSFKLRAQGLIEGGGDLRLSIGPASTSTSFTLNGSANRPFLVNFSNDGQVSIEHASFDQRHSASFNPNATQDVTLLINDLDIDALTVNTPDGGKESLPPNSILLYLGDERVGLSTFDDRTEHAEFDTRPINLGRLSLHTLTSATGIDFGVGELRVESLHPYYPGPFPKDEFQHRVLLDENFDTDTSDVTTLPNWQLTDGSALLPVANGALVFDDTTAGAVSAQRFFRDGMEALRDPDSDELGPYFYVRFHLTIEEPPELGSSGYFLGYNNPVTIENMRGFIWLKSDENGQANLGLSTANNDINFASQSLVQGETYTIVVRYDLSRNDAWLWINPSVNDEPTITAQQPDDISYYRVDAITANFNAANQLGRFRVGDLRAATSLRAALADGHFGQPPTSTITRTSSSFIVESDDYDALLDHYGNLSSLNAFGEQIVSEALWDKVTYQIDDYLDRRNISEQYAKSQTDLIMTHIDASDARLSLFFQNNDEAENATYVIPFSTTDLIAITTDDGVRHVAPFSDTLERVTNEIILECTGGETWVRGIDTLTLNSASQSGRPVTKINLPSRSLRQLDFHFGELVLIEPTEYRVFQRDQLSSGLVRVCGRAPSAADSVEVRFSGESTFNGSFSTTWQAVAFTGEPLGQFDDSFRIPSGGWHTAEVRVLEDGAVIAEQTISRFGVGEVFVCAGQSNSTNTGTDPVDQTSGMVAAYTGGHWQLGNDPFPGNHDSTSKGSYYSTLGDQLYARLGVPIAFASTGHGGTHIALWQPDVAYRYTSFTYARYNGIYDWTLHRILQLGQDGFRTVLWHQGESDSSHTPGIERTSEQEYYDGLSNVIQQTRTAADWDIPWFVAQTSVWPIDNPDGDENIQAAQQRLWSDGVAHEGANSDLIGIEYRQFETSRVHFRPIGLRRHAELWEVKLGDHIDALNGGVFALDSDGDSLPDFWERAFALPVSEAASASSNQDGDRYTDYEEFIAGSDPLNSSDFPDLKLSHANEQLALDYQARPHRRYLLWQSNNLQDWSLAREDIATQATDIRIEAELTSEPTFYRLQWLNELDTE